MLAEVYCWLESRTGVSYDFNQELVAMSKDVIFIDPGEFQIDYQQIRNELTQCCIAIDKFKDEIPDDLPRYDELKRLFVGTVLHGVTSIINDIMDKMNIKRIDFNSMAVLDNSVTLLCELCDLFRYNSLESIINEHMFDTLNATNENAYTDMFEIVSSDVANMYYTVDAIRDMHDEND